jgi:hypothetical protein
MRDNEMSGCAKWFLIILVLSLFFGLGNVIHAIFSLVGYAVLALFILALLIS